jgi:hypothetical protein
MTLRMTRRIHRRTVNRNTQARPKQRKFIEPLTTGRERAHKKEIVCEVHLTTLRTTSGR